MNQPSDDVTQETLKELTNAPNVNEPLVSQDAFETVEMRSSRPLWQMPLPKLAVIGITLVPVFVLAGYFLVGGDRQSESADADQPSSTSDTSGEASNTFHTDELEQLRQENATLKANSALDGQDYLLVQQRTPQQQPDNIQVESPPVASSAPQGTSARPTSSPSSTVSHRPPPPTPQQTAPTTRPVVSVSTTTPDDQLPQVPQIDPGERWHQLSRLGSYGAIAPPETLPMESGPQSTALEATPEVLTASAAPVSVPVAQVAPTSAIQASDEQPVAIPVNAEMFLSRVQTKAELKQASMTPSNNTEITVFTAAPAILHEAEAAILEGRPPLQSLIAGAHSSGHLATPLILDTPDSRDRFIVVIAEPLVNNQGHIAIPSGSKLLVQVDRVSESGVVELSATTAVWQEDGQQKEIVLPDRAIRIRGKNGAPLIADSLSARNANLLERDAQQFAIGAIRGAAELYTRSDTRIQTSNGTTIVTEAQSEPNILAGALQGGTEAILDTLADRNQRVIEEAQNHPEIRFVAAGTAVQVFVNQSMQMPM